MIDVAALTAAPCFDVFAEEVTINGSPARGIPANEIVESAAFDQVAEHRLTLSVLTQEVPLLPKGATVIVRGKTYRVDMPVATTEDPDVVTKVVLR